MTRRILAVMLLIALILTVGITAFAGETGIWYNVTVPPLGSAQILSDTKSEGTAKDYYCIELTGGTAASIIGSSNKGGRMKVYKGQGYMKIYYDPVPADGTTVKLYASLTSTAHQTASGNSFCN